MELFTEARANIIDYGLLVCCGCERDSVVSNAGEREVKQLVEEKR